MNFWYTIIEGFGFGLGLGAFQLGGKLWEKAVGSARVWLSSRSIQTTGTPLLTEATQGLWPPSQKVTPQNYKYSPAVDRSKSLRAAKERLEKLEAALDGE